MSQYLNKLSDQVFLTMLGFSCNNNCIMCTTKPKEKNYKDRTTQEILDDLQEGIKQGFRRVELQLEQTSKD